MATQEIIRAIKIQSTEARELIGDGADLTYEQYDSLGEDSAGWLESRLGYTVTETDLCVEIRHLGAYTSAHRAIAQEVSHLWPQYADAPLSDVVVQAATDLGRLPTPGEVRDILHDAEEDWTAERSAIHEAATAAVCLRCNEQPCDCARATNEADR